MADDPTYGCLWRALGLVNEIRIGLDARWRGRRSRGELLRVFAGARRSYRDGNPFRPTSVPYPAKAQATHLRSVWAWVARAPAQAMSQWLAGLRVLRPSLKAHLVPLWVLRRAK